MSDLTLVIGNKAYSSWSMRPWFLMRRAGIPFAEIRVPLRQPDTGARILAHSPSGKVPALLAPEGTIWESLAIAEYLAERFPDKRLWPAAGDARAVARSVAAEMHGGFATLRRALPFNCRRCGMTHDQSAEVDAEIARIIAIWTDCRARFGAEGAFLFGAPGVADAMFAPVVSRFLTYGVAVSGTAAAYVQTVYRDPAYQAWVAEALAETEVIADFEPKPA